MVSKILKDDENSRRKSWIAEAYANGIAYSDADARDYVASVAGKALLEKTFVDYSSADMYMLRIFIIRKIFWIRQRRSIFILMIWRPAGRFVRNGRIWMMWQ